MSSILTWTTQDKCEGYREDSFYPTPWEATESFMLAEEPWLESHRVIDEPACGTGDMAEVIVGHGKTVFATDLVYRGYGIGGQDFLLRGTVKCGTALITNPPYDDDLAEGFIRMAHEKRYDYIAMLLKSNYWHAQKRHPLFMRHRPVRIRPLGWRVDFTGGGSNHFDCIWCVWMPDQQSTTEYCAPLEKPKYRAQKNCFRSIDSFCTIPYKERAT